MRQWIDNNQGAIAGISIVIILLFVAWMIFGGGDAGSRTPEDQTWYFDFVEQQSFRSASRQIPPIESPWGNEAVSVFYFSCGECTEEERFPGFYMKYSNEMKAKLEADEQLKAQAFGESHPGRMYSNDGKTWVAALNVAGAGITDALRDRCFGKLRTCR